MIGALVYLAVALFASIAFGILYNGWYRLDLEEQIMSGLACVLIGLFWPITMPAMLVAIIGERVNSGDLL